jgi:hypothetical protein
LPLGVYLARPRVTASPSSSVRPLRFQQTTKGANDFSL